MKMAQIKKKGRNVRRRFKKPTSNKKCQGRPTSCEKPTTKMPSKIVNLPITKKILPSTSLLPHRFRRKDPPEAGKCDSIYCQGFEKCEACLLHCNKCHNILHVDCLGIENRITNRFACSGCRLNAHWKVTKSKYVRLRNKLRRHYAYIKRIASGTLGSWRMRDFLKGGLARRNLLFASSLSFVSEEEAESMVKLFKSWVTEWKMFKDQSEAMKFSFDVLVPEALIRMIMEVENVHRDHAEYLLLRSRFE